MSPHPWDDESVSRLPISGGRAELLEEIMSTPTTSTAPTRPDPDGPPPRHRRWLVPLAVAAAVAALVAGPLWWFSGAADRDTRDAGTGAAGAPSGGGDLMVLDEPGWQVDYVSESAEYGSSVSYTHGRASLEIDAYPAENYRSYYQDRRHITDPPSDGDPVDVLGETASMWAYSANDHTVIRPVEGDRFYEARGSGLDEQAFLALLGSLRLVDHDTFDAMLPDRFVNDAERPQAVQDVLDGIGGALDDGDPVLPPDDDSPINSQQSDPYQLGAAVAGQVACRWFAAYQRADDAGDAAAAQTAVDVMSTSRQWPVLQDMAAEGGFSDVVWDLSDRIADGKAPAGYEGALGCTG